VRSTRYTPRPRESAFVARRNKQRLEECGDSSCSGKEDALRILKLFLCSLAIKFCVHLRFVSPYSREPCESVRVCARVTAGTRNILGARPGSTSGSTRGSSRGSTRGIDEWIVARIDARIVARIDARDRRADRRAGSTRGIDEQIVVCVKEMATTFRASASDSADATRSAEVVAALGEGRRAPSKR